MNSKPTFDRTASAPWSPRTLLHRLGLAALEVGDDGRIEWCNPAAEALIGLQARYLIGQAVWDVLILETRAGERLGAEDFPRVGVSVARRKPDDLDVIFDHPAQGLRPVRLLAAPRSEDGFGAPPSGALLVIEADWRRGASAEDISDLIGTVSHEMRSPITSILGLAGLMRTRDVPPEKMRQYLEIIEQDADRLRRLVDDLQDYQRLSCKRQVYRLGPVDLADLIGRAVAGASAGGAGGHIAAELPDNLPPALGDPQAVARVLDNLIANAVKYSPDGGAIVVRASAQAGEIVVTVRDQGQGFDPADAGRLFEKFYRLPGAEASRIRGTGLGLAIVMEIVQALGGRVWANSDGSGLGSTFGFALAAADAQRK